MSKAILVLDKMPKSCSECRLKSTVRGIENVIACCNLAEGMITLDDGFKKRLDNCPLKELPEKLPEFYDLMDKDNKGNYIKVGTSADSVAIGFNQCLDKIEGNC